MLFNSFPFIIFFLVVTSLYFLLPFKVRWLMLLTASCVFYMFFVPVYILILFVTIIIDYFAGIAIENAQGKRRKTYLIISIISNVGILAFFKYYNFFIDNINSVGELFNWNYHIELLKIILPIGLSFHTFQAMSYTIEVYRGNQKAEKHFGIYALYVMYYPQLVAGPIERPQNLLSQFHTDHKLNPSLVSNGLKQMLIGFFKKMVIADNLAPYVNQVYDSPGDYEPITILMATFFFAIQIFCDFSGYSDIALGASRIMGIELMQNFKAPYFSISISDFWSRWHISLSTWFKDYVYIPLGGNRVPEWRRFFNLLFVFLISGFWHGANWTFVIWGFLHGTYTVFEILLNKLNSKTIDSTINKSNMLISFFKRVIVFYLVCFAWIFFRATDVSSGIYIAKQYLAAVPDYLQNLTHSGYLWLEPLIFKRDIHINIVDFALLAFSVLLLYAINRIEYRQKFIQYLDQKLPVFRWGFYQVLLVLIIVFGVFHSKHEFIYFQF